MVELEHVTLSYGSGVDGVSDLSLTVPDGEFCFITGKSGSGKSTLSKLLTAELQPSEGNIKVNGYTYGKLGSRAKAEVRRTIGMVFQDFRLIPDMTVMENLEFAMRCVAKNSYEIQRRVEEVLDLVELSGVEHRLPTELSGGEQQRIAIARAIINHPTLIIADEPTGNLDPSLAGSIMDLFFKINAMGTTIIVITHAKELVEQRAARVVTLGGGKIISDRMGVYTS